MKSTVSPQMSEGEKMVWAAVYATHRTSGRIGDSEYTMASHAAKEAWRAVVALRFGVNLTSGEPDGDAMWLEMTGMKRSPEGKLYRPLP